MTSNGRHNDTSRDKSARRRRATTPPDDLDAQSRTFWRRTLGQLKAQGTWQDSDVPTLERYVRASELARRSREHTPDHGTTRGAAGQFVEHPLIRTVREAERDAHRYAEALLLMPADRRKLGLEERRDDNPFLPSWLQH